MKKKVKLVKCAHCPQLCDASEDYCYGCDHVVCVNCVFKFGHIIGGGHGPDKRKSA